MIEAPAGVDLWELQADATVITTNGDVNSNGRAVMGRGCALEAKQRFRGIDQILGWRLRDYGNHVHLLAYAVNASDYEFALVTFPVKHHWNEQADSKLIARSTRELIALANLEGWETVVMPRPGCGNGRLSWDRVRPMLADLDDRFVIVHK